MPKQLQTHASERIDKTDLDFLIQQSGVEEALNQQLFVLDRQARVVRGFRIEIPNQVSFPGRIVVHGGAAYTPTGVRLFNDSQYTISRTITLQGAVTTFYIEVEFNGSPSNVDPRAFWDPTVDQGLDTSGDELPDGQEYSNTIATRIATDWKIVQPVSTLAFTRDTPGSSLTSRVPLVQLSTDGSNQIVAGVNPGLTTEKFATTLLERVSATQIRVQNAQLIPGAGQPLIIGEGVTGTEAEETVTVVSNDVDEGLVVTSVMVRNHSPGDIIRGGTGTAEFVSIPNYGRYRRPNELNTYDHRDKLWQADEVHGEILSKGHGSITERSDVNLQSLKDHIDFLAAQLAEMKWGALNPWDAPTATTRIPPGLQLTFPSELHYYDNAGSIIGARTAAITVGDGVNSRGDFNGTDHAAIQAAHDALPASGGRIFLKRGTYKLSTVDFNWTNTGSVTLEGEEGSIIEVDGFKVHIATTGDIRIKNLIIQEASTSAAAQTGIAIDTNNPAHFIMEDVRIFNCSFDLDAVLPGASKFKNLELVAVSGNMALRPLIRAVGVASVLSGEWTGCILAHWTFTPLQASIIDMNYGVTPTVSANLLDFVDCTFVSIQLNLESVHLGSSLYAVQFTRCKFSSLVTVVHVKATGGSNLKFNECFADDVFASLVYANNVDNVEVDAYLNPNPVGVAFPPIDLVDCNNIKVVNCHVNINYGLLPVFPGNAGISVLAQAQDVTDVFISGNTILASLDFVTGVKLDVNGWDIRRVRVVNNYTSACAVGVAMLATGAGVYEDVSIDGNHIKDQDDGGIAVYQKLGIYGAAGATYNKININGNHIQNCNPPNTNVLVGGTTRQGIIIKGSLTRSTISNNEIKEVGNNTSLLGNTASIWLTLPSSVTVSDNVIDQVLGVSNTSGIQLGETSNVAQRCVVSNNVIANVYDDTGTAWGVHWYKLSASTFTGNLVSGLTTNLGSNTAAFGVQDPANGLVSECTFTGNKCVASDAQSNMFLFVVNKLYRVSITGNECSGVYFTGDEKTGIYKYFLYAEISVVGDRLWYLTINNNIGHLCSSGNVKIVAGSGSAERVSISNNTFQVDGNQNIEVDVVSYLSVNGNILENSGLNAADRNVLITGASSKIVVINNNCALIAGIGKHIELLVGATKYQINHNICDASGGVPTTIDTSAATGVGVVYGNLADNVGAYHGSDSGVTAGAVHERVY